MSAKLMKAFSAVITWSGDDITYAVNVARETYAMNESNNDNGNNNKYNKKYNNNNNDNDDVNDNDKPTAMDTRLVGIPV